MEYQRFIVGDLMVNCYLFWSGNEAGIIDPGGSMDQAVQFITEKKLQLQWILNTHGHADHILGNAELKQRYNAPILIHQADRPMLTSAIANLSAFIGELIVSPDADRVIHGGDIVKLGTEEFLVIETPGHTPGGISLYTKGYLFSGDSLFRESIGRTDLPGGDYQKLMNSIKERLLTLPGDTAVLPGHEALSTIAHEIQFNPFLLADHGISY